MKHINEYFSQSEKASLISEYLLSKSKNKTFDDFKQFKTKEEVCDFFDSKGFEKFGSDDDLYEDMMSEFANSDKPIYCIGEFNNFYDNWWVRFGNGGEDEYVFFYNIKNPSGVQNYSVKDSNDHKIKQFKTFEEFKDYTIKYFNW